MRGQACQTVKTRCSGIIMGKPRGLNQEGPISLFRGCYFEECCIRQVPCRSRPQAGPVRGVAPKRYGVACRELRVDERMPHSLAETPRLVSSDTPVAHPAIGTHNRWFHGPPNSLWARLEGNTTGDTWYQQRRYVRWCNLTIPCLFPSRLDH